MKQIRILTLAAMVSLLPGGFVGLSHTSALAQTPATKPAKPFSIFDLDQDDPRLGPPKDLSHALPPQKPAAPAPSPSSTPTPRPTQPNATLVAEMVRKAIDEVDAPAPFKTFDTRAGDLMEIIKFQLRIKDAAGVRATYQKLRPLLGTDKSSFVTDIIAAGECGDLETAQKIADQCIATATSPIASDSARSWLATEQARNGKMAEAMATLALVRAGGFHSSALRQIAWGGVLSLGPAQMEKFLAGPGPGSESHSLSSMAVEALARSGDVAAATHMAESLPTPMSRESVTLLAIKSQAATDPMAALARLRAEKSNPIYSSAWQIVAYQFIKARKYPEALEASEYVLSLSKINVLTRLIAAQLDEGLTADAMKTLDHWPASSSGVDYRKAEMLAKIQAAGGHIAEAMATVDSIPFNKQERHQEHQWALLGVIRAQARHGDAAGALKRASAIERLDNRDLPVQDFAFKEIAEELARTHDYAGARDAARQAKGAYREDALQMVAIQQALDGEFAEAKKTIQSMGIYNQQGKAARLVASLAVGSNPAAMADDMLRLASSIRSRDNKIWLYLGIAEGINHIHHENVVGLEDWGMW